MTVWRGGLPPPDTHSLFAVDYSAAAAQPAAANGFAPQAADGSSAAAAQGFASQAAAAQPVALSSAAASAAGAQLAALQAPEQAPVASVKPPITASILVSLVFFILVPLIEIRCNPYKTELPHTLNSFGATINMAPHAKSQ